MFVCYKTTVVIVAVIVGGSVVDWLSLALLFACYKEDLLDNCSRPGVDAPSFFSVRTLIPNLCTQLLTRMASCCQLKAR